MGVKVERGDDWKPYPTSTFFLEPVRGEDVQPPKEPEVSAKDMKTLDRAAVKLWKVFTATYFMQTKVQDLQSKLKHTFFEEYYKNDLSGIMDQTCELFKSRFSLILEEVG